jgi:hypothetical protein
MSEPCLSSEEVGRRGEALYAGILRDRVDEEANVGKILSIDIETGDYEIGDDPVATAGRLHARHPGAAVWTRRIGYNAVYAIGGTLSRISD